ncbi:hypothetical protein Vadar_033136 [Vaccinium darrowii]|uniref:Uncharacterized protein n=1 Tax=Vaccinium darrowii TaxID=229202 RepID=A0ACB7YR72_9ERIC|nr:hypothetical protein Vadar_033136 [Vaccinium darrowii]
MNSRMNYGRGFLNPPENEVQIRAPWVPRTPGNPIAQRSNGNGMPAGRQVNQQPGTTNFQDLVGCSDRLFQPNMNYNATWEKFNTVGFTSPNGSYDLGIQQAVQGGSNQRVRSYENFGNNNAACYNNPLAEVFATRSSASAAPVNGASSRNVHSENVLPTILNSYSIVDSSWTEGNFTSLLLGSENPNLDSNNPNLDSNHRIMADKSPQMPRDGFPAPFRPNYNLNSPPRSEADATSSTTNSFPFAPVTPDHAKQFENHRRSVMLSFSVDESSSQEKDKLESLLSSSEAIEDCTELLQNIVDASSAAGSTLLTEKNNFVGVDQGIDLNKTPQLKPPKRRKHRPKVVVEGKPKRTPKPKPPQNSNSKETPSGKRKYVRKKPVVTDEDKLPTFEPKEKSCRMKLNFDLENEKNGELQGKADNLPEKVNQGNPADFNLKLDSHTTQLCARINSVGAETTEIMVQNGRTFPHNHSMNQMPAERIPLPERHSSCASPTAIKYHTLNALARSLSMRNGSPYQNSDKNGYSHEHHLQRELNKNVSQKQQNTCINPEETRQMTWHNTPQIVERNPTNSNEKRGLKREYHNRPMQAGFASYSQMDSPFLHWGIYQVHDHNTNSHNFGTSSETQKRRRMENEFHITEGRNSVYAKSSTFNSRISDFYFGGDRTSAKLMNGVNSSSGGRQSHCMTSAHTLQKQIQASELHPKLSGSTHIQNMSSLIMMANSHLLSSTPSKRGPLTSCFEQGVETSQAKMSQNRLQTALTSSGQVSHDYRQSFMKTRGQPGQQQYSDAIQEITCRLQGLNIAGWSKDNHRQEQNAIVPYKGDGAMVPYEGFDLVKKRKPRPKVDLDPETNRIWLLLMGKEGSEGAGAEDKSKEKWWEEERKVFCGRADSFIARMHLVQGDRRFSRWKGSVVDSVIGVFLTQNVSDHLSSSAFMSLAARFPFRSKTTDPECYKSGTSVSAKEPAIQMLFPNGTIRWHDEIPKQPVYKQPSVLYHESESRAGDPTSGTGRTSLATELNRMGNESLSSSQNSFNFLSLQVNKGVESYTGSNSEPEDSNCKSQSNLINGPPALPHMRRTSQFQELQKPVNGSLCFDERSTYLHNQSAHINYNWQIPGLEVNNLKNPATLTHPMSSNISQHKQGSTVPPAYFQMQMTQNSAAQGVGHFRIFTEESMRSLPSTPSGITNGKERGYASRTGHTIEKTFVQQNGVPMIQAPTFGHSSQTGRGHFSLSAHQQERSKTFHLESKTTKETLRPTEAVAKRQSGTRHQLPKDPQNRSEAFGAEKGTTISDKQKFQDTKVVEANAKDELYSSSKTTTRMSTTMSNARKGKREDEKRNSFDWDSLRKLVEPNGTKNERSKETMDSLDYEALRRADVNEISNAIKERGMNNMLAERIQDFLNRLVRDHGSIDLEWLRDVPPDKAKDYLLSIWGLGLKSVECVRLLTLHHLAFPVDTNVGRIAVRLGWVPLQPLPESLQLHLLELYPMLETIQKYLWPRLCKLDQRTLYELHYQMITFGKVFCTKSKPNCNACPMRGECRHFASAFASARLALPGPEEKSIVSSTTPPVTDKSPPIEIRHMPLLTAGRNEPKEIGSVLRNCEPIVEEPATPEPETAEVTVSDIEDAFYEDPDEIPTIKLNLEEFTLNLHNYVQENMELQEGDMSKALVALNPQAASIPTPKLKNVSRLRTEHQVYELPDSHPLLNGLDKREPDDPSPYLLAIWTPGETANTVQLPEGRCGSQESGKLCNEKTCFSCNSMREANAHTVRGTILIPCRTAMRGSFPLNGTYFQVNEMFADHESSLNPIDVPRAWIWNLPRRTVYFGTSVSTIFKGLTTEGIQYCFWRGFVCVRGFDHRTRAPRPLMARLHFPASKLAKTKNEDK